MNKTIQLDPKDNVAVAITDLEIGEKIGRVQVTESIPATHKLLLRDIKKGEAIIKYGSTIGVAKRDLEAGCLVHCDEIASTITGVNNFEYLSDTVYSPQESNHSFMGYCRRNGKVGIRNELWIIPTVGCVNSIAKDIENKANALYSDMIDGIHAFTHPYGCSQSGYDQDSTRRLLAGIISHPNAGGVLVLSLGCENTNISTLLPYLGEYDKDRIKFLVCQDSEDEVGDALSIINELVDTMKNDKREKCNINKLKIGYKCGGSDAYSGITANYLCGLTNNHFTKYGATTILTETPEMFGAEHILSSRCANSTVHSKFIDMITRYKTYLQSNGAGYSENPSPGNMDGGISTLEEKSLGCVQKGGTSTITDVLDYAQAAISPGLNLLYGPGNDIVANTNLVCAGAQIILFTTGRGTPLGAPVPTIKISSNSQIASKKRNWIDFDASEVLTGDVNRIKNSLLSLIYDVCNGKLAKNEITNNREISIFKNGVIL